MMGMHLAMPCVTGKCDHLNYKTCRDVVFNSVCGMIGQLGEGITYLACPRMHHDVRVMNARCVVADKVAGDLMGKGRMVFSPISHGHRIGLSHNWSWDTWQKFDTAIIGMCSKMALVPISGWQESRGVQDELFLAQTYGVEVERLNLEEFGITFDFPYIIPGGTDE